MRGYKFKPRSKFEKWVRVFGGQEKLAEALSVHRTTVIYWCTRRSMPNLLLAQKILKLAEGEISLDDLVNGTKTL